MAGDDPVLAFAAEELRTFMAGAPDVRQWHIELAPDRAMRPFTFSVAGPADRHAPRTLICRGHSTTEVLHAAYTALERAGMLFDVTGPARPARLDTRRWIGWSTTVVPAVQARGVRLHMNFPMDISSYPIDEAREYIRNLARLRLNQVIFHSYGGHWYATEGRKPSKGGVFFYGIRYDIPDQWVLRGAIRNDRTFCIPEIEASYNNAEESGRRAIEWLNAVMTEAKRCGLSVRFSIEADQNRQTVESILKAYPLIDSFEVITTETLEDREVDAARVRETFAAALGSPTMQPAAGEAELPPLFRQVLGNIRQVRELRPVLAARDKPIGLSVAVYCPAKRLHQAVVPLLREFVPQGVEYAILPAHGALAVAENVQAVPLTGEDWRRATVYTWAEFDGSMYLQQNPVEGLRRLLREGQTRSGGQPLHGLSLNHWRTAENRTAFRYGAVAMVEGAVEPRTFYSQYAARLGIAQPEKYAAAMAKLDEADTFVRDRLFNVGFCYLGLWGRTGLGRIGRVRPDHVASASEMYAAVGRELATCRAATHDAAGRQYLDFLLNRIDCTVLHLQAVGTAARLQAICLRPATQPATAAATGPGTRERDPSELTPEQRTQVREICDQSLALMERYMALHAKAMPDRGCEGTLISYYYIPPVVIRRIRDTYGNP